MIWKNEFSLADIISIVMLLATFITILLILIQRHDANRPYISLRASKQEKTFAINDLKFLMRKVFFSLFAWATGLLEKSLSNQGVFLEKQKKNIKI